VVRSARRRPPEEAPEELPEEGEEQGLRPFWSGMITFGLVSVPVALFSASRGAGMRMRMTTEEGHLLQRRYLCPEEDRLLDSEEIVRGFERKSGEFVIMSDEDLAKLAPKKSREIELERFVDRSEINPRWFERSYFLAPDRETVKPYRLLAEVMEESDRVGVGTFIMRGKPHVVAILSEGGILRAQTLRFQEELRDPETVGLEPAEDPEPAVLKKMAREIDALVVDEFPEDLMVDEDAERLEQLVESKAEAGLAVGKLDEAESERAEIVDLIDVLKERLGETKSKKKRA
jgi:DNA end-binding protein Ku